VNFGQLGAVVAATVAASYPVGPGAVVVVSVSAEVNAASVIIAAGATSGSVTFTRGNGI
jgi:threonine/homoserine/homoserine lactone efflux protein